MYRGFNLTIPEGISNNEYSKTGKQVKNKVFDQLKERLVDLAMVDGIIDGNKVIDKWFPPIECDIFLSHSHKDETKAEILAGMLDKHLGLKTFIDSTVWGFSDILLKFLDDEFCKNEGSATYSYEKRNFSTTHVHLMLSSALNKMIDNCEAIFFLNTPNSISISDTVANKTKSPWIFSEIATTQIIRKKTPQRLKEEIRTFSNKLTLKESIRAQLAIEYEVELSHFKNLDFDSIKNWIDKAEHSNDNPLDVLYSIHQINSKFLVR